MTDLILAAFAVGVLALLSVGLGCIVRAHLKGDQ